MLRKRIAGMLGLALLAMPVATLAEGEGKFGAEVFADMYYIAANHDSTLEDLNGLWFRRINLTYDYKFDDALSARVRLETASPGDFPVRVAMITFVKDAYLKYTRNTHNILVGLSQAPLVTTAEGLWGYRSLEKVPAELQRLGSSRDMGLAFNGTNASKVFGYNVMLGNGAGVESETNAKKKVAGAFTVRPGGNFVFEVYGDYEDRENDADRTTASALAGWQSDKFRAGLQYIWQNRNTIGEDTEIAMFSGFATGEVSENVWLVGRVDRNIDPNPEGNRILFLPFDRTAANIFVLAAVDFRVRDNISIMPNVEAVVYDEPEAGGEAPDSDIMPRLTFAWKY